MQSREMEEKPTGRPMDDVRTSAIALIGLIGAILTFAVVILLMVAYHHVAARELYEKQISQSPAELANVLANQQARLTEYRWVDQNKGVVTIPIDRAMELVVAELSSADHPTSSGEPLPVSAKGGEATTTKEMQTKEDEREE